MLLKDLQTGKRFMFDDRKTPVALTTARGQFDASGTFEFVGVVENASPKLKHVESGKELIAVANTFYRWILPII
jgi:hypothetical protein